MTKVHILNKFQRNPYSGKEIDATSNSGRFRWLSPFLLPAPPAQNLENLWQFSKVYPDQVDFSGNPTNEWFWWRRDGFYDVRAHRYPKGKGAIPLYSIYPQSYDNRCTEHLGYIEARKRIYAAEYAKNVIKTDSFVALKELFEHGVDISLRDYDGYDYQLLGFTLRDVINDPTRKMGHAFVLAMLLEGVLSQCLDGFEPETDILVERRL